MEHILKPQQIDGNALRQSLFLNVEDSFKKLERNFPKKNEGEVGAT